MEEQLKQLSQKIDILTSEVSKLKRYFLITVWVTIALFVLPLIGLMFAVPSFLSTYSDLGSLGL